MEQEYEIEFRFIDKQGRDVTGTEAVAGYHFRDFFSCSIVEASVDELRAAYKGPDVDGIGVEILTVN